jgi:Fe-Mn family superoxide dismutase
MGHGPPEIEMTKQHLPPLPYDYDALEPFISAATMKLHHGAHHGGYVQRLDALISGSPLEGATLEEIVRRSAPGARGAAGSPLARPLIFNNAAQAWNHAFFWSSLRPVGGARPVKSQLARFADQLKSAAVGLFGSGWVWLVEEGGTLKVTSTANADTPLVHGQKPLLAIDVWEHAYYLDRQNRRDLYVASVVDHLLDWEFAERNLLGEGVVHAG